MAQANAAAAVANIYKTPVKLLANGEVSQAVTVRGLRMSASARQKIEAAGGRVEE